MTAVLDQAGGWPLTLEGSAECPPGSPFPPTWHGSPQEEQEGCGAGRRHTICGRPLCWQQSSPCVAVIQRLVLGMQMSF